jgi:hypothetical protein
MKKFLALLTFIVVTNNSVIFAAENTNEDVSENIIEMYENGVAVEDDNAVTRASKYIDICEWNIDSNSSKKVTVNASMDRLAGSKCKIEITLIDCDNSNNTFSPVSVTTSNYYAALDRDFTTISGHSYSAKIVFSVLNSSGTVLDKETVTSKIVVSK